MRHRHLTLEQYELALEEDDPRAVERLRRQAEACPVCAAAQAQAPLAPVLAAWEAPVSFDGRVDWEAVFRRAVAPASRRPRPGWPGAWRPVAVGALLVGLMFVAALPAAASTGPESVLFPVRGLEEDVRWGLTPEPDRAALEADLVSAYLWEARTSAARHDSESYQAAMQRFFKWAARLKADIPKASPAQRSSAREAVSAARALVTPLTTSGPDPAEAREAESIISEVESESQNGEDERQRGSGTQGGQSGPASTGSRGASHSGDAAPSPADSPDSGEHGQQPSER